jgi:microcystin-dependent protein
VAAPIGTFTTLNATSQNFTGLLSFANASGTGNLTVQQYISSASLYTRNANVSTLLTAGAAQFNTLSTGTFAAGELDTKLVSSITGNIQFNLVSTLQLQAKISVSPNINLGLGDVIQGLVGGAATQALGVGIGTAGLITGAVALVTGRTQGGVNNTVFQTVNGSTQLQFSTIGEAALSVFLTTNSSDPLHAPGTEIRQSVLVPANTYCVRSVSDPLYVDSSTQSIQMFGQWVPVIQAGASFGVLNTSNLNTSTLTAITASISTLRVSTLIGNSIAPLDLTASSITMSGNLVGTNQNANINWAGSSKFLSTATQQISFVDAGNTFQGEIYGINQPNTGVTVVAPNGLRIQNAQTPLIPTIGFNTNSTVDIYSTLRVSQIQNYGTANISTLNVSTLNATIQSVIPSTLNVSTLRFSGDILGTGIGIISTQALFISSINGLPPGGGGGGLTIPSTLFASTIIANGRITVTTNNSDVNGGIYLPFPGIVSTFFVNTETTISQYGYFTSTLQASNFTVTGSASINSLTLNNLGVANTAGINIANTNTLSVTGTATIGTANTATTRASRFYYADTNNNVRGYATGGNQDISQIGVFTVAPTGFYISKNDNLVNPLMSLGADSNAYFYNILSAPLIESQNLKTNTLEVTRNASISTLTVQTIIGPDFGGNPTGAVIVWAGGLATNTNFQVPSGYLLCDGSLYPIATYPNLFAVIGQNYVNAKTLVGGSFYVPDLTFAVPMGAPAKGAGGYQVSITFTTAPASSYQISPTDYTTWLISARTLGTLVVGTLFPNVPGSPGGVGVVVTKIITFDGTSGQILVQSRVAPGTVLPNFTTATSIVSQGVVNPNNAVSPLYNLGTQGIYGNPQPYRTQDPTEVGVHVHNYINGPDTTDNVAGGTSLCGFGTKQSGTNSGAGTINAGASNTSLQYSTAPNFVNMSYIIKV